MVQNFDHNQTNIFLPKRSTHSNRCGIEVSSINWLNCVFFSLLFFYGSSAFTQSNSINVVYIFEEDIEKSLLPAKEFFSDSTELNTYLVEYLNRVRNDGHLEASIDKVIRKDSLREIHLHLGPVYQSLNLTNGNIPKPFLNSIGYRAKNFKNKAFNFERIKAIQEKLLVVAEENGYPFAEVFLDSIQIRGYDIEAQLFITLNTFISWRDININGDLNLSTSYLEKYLGIREGIAFDASRFKKIDKRLQEIPFANISQPSGIRFNRNSADLELFLKKRRSSRFDFIIGFLPNSQLQGRFQLTGAFDAELQNSFGQGERIMAKFEQLRPETQLLELAFNYPYVLNLPFGTDFQFQLYRRDTSYLDLELHLGIPYMLEGNNYVKVFWSNRSSSLLGINDALLLSTQQLPIQLDVSYPAFGVELLWQNLDYRFNPSKGWEVLFNGSVGSKRIRRNAQIEELDLGFLYDSLVLRSSQYRLRFNGATYLPLFPNTTLKTGIQSAFIFSNQPIYQNEQYRLGGNKLMRGFDEEFFFATNYAVLTAEFRLLIDTNSYLYLFGDYGWLENVTTTQQTTSQVLGFGSGISFETRAGIFGISLAFGRQQGLALDLSSPKVHFGYVSRF